MIAPSTTATFSGASSREGAQIPSSGRSNTSEPTRSRHNGRRIDREEKHVVRGRGSPIPSSPPSSRPPRAAERSFWPPSTGACWPPEHDVVRGDEPDQHPSHRHVGLARGARAGGPGLRIRHRVPGALHRADVGDLDPRDVDRHPRAEREPGRLSYDRRHEPAPGRVRRDGPGAGDLLRGVVARRPGRASCRRTSWAEAPSAPAHPWQHLDVHEHHQHARGRHPRRAHRVGGRQRRSC